MNVQRPQLTHICKYKSVSMAQLFSSPRLYTLLGSKYSSYKLNGEQTNWMDQRSALALARNRSVAATPSSKGCLAPTVSTRPV